MKFFDDIEISINKTGILADSASLDSQNSLEPAYTIGKRSSITQTPAGNITNDFQFTYYPDFTNEPNYSLVNYIKNLNNDWNGAEIVFGGVTGYNTYLQNYNIKATTNDLVVSSVSYASFTNTSGQLLPRDTGVVYINSGTFGHGWTTHVYSTGSALSIPIFEFEYDINFEWKPLYKIGQKTPFEVKLMNIEEIVTIQRETFKNILFTGEDICGNILGTDEGQFDVQFLGLEFLCSGLTGNGIVFDLSGVKVRNNKLNNNLDDIARVTTTFYRNS